MQPYNPQPDISGQLILQAQQNASNSLQQGVQQAANGISNAITTGAMQHLAAQGSLAAMQPAVDAGLIKQSDLDNILSMHPAAQIGAVNTLHHLIPQIALNNYRNSWNSIRQQNADLRGVGGATTTF